MRAVCYEGVNHLEVQNVPDPKITNPHDAIVRVRLTTTCGSDLHLLGGYIPTMKKGDIIGHEFMGEVVETGPEARKVKKGDRVVVTPIIGCGHCWFCENQQWSLCDNTNPNAGIPEKLWGQSIAGVFGYSHMLGGYAGSHADYIRVPFADNGCFKIPDGVTDEQALFVSDAFPTGFMAADLCDLKGGEVVAVWGCGGVGQMAIRSAYLLGASRVIAIDRFPDRLRMAEERGTAEVLNYEEVDIHEALKEMTGGRGPDVCIDCVGMEAHESGPEYWYDKAKQTVRLETDRPIVLRQMIHACRKGGTLSIVGVYGGFVDKFPIGAAMNKALTFRMGQQHGQRYADRLLNIIKEGKIDPSYLATHRMSLDDAPRAYQAFKTRQDGMLRAVFTTNRR
jgi:threonine dehydrogenase-like Zn-dependent dehydrogenase